MLIRKANSIVIATLFNDKVYTLPDSEDWSIWLKEVKNTADNTITTFMRSMSRFWEWSLYNPIGVSESFPFYQARYRKDLRNGFDITIQHTDEDFNDPLEITVCSSKSLKKTTINKELAGINSYFYFTEESSLIEDHRFINYLYEKHKSEKGFLGGIQMKKSPSAKKSSGSRKKYLTPYKTTMNRNDIKYFPYELFDELLAMSKPRERLIYLLCGAAAARIGQALNLTLYDIDYDAEEVWLIDPKSEDEDMYGEKRVDWLKEKYNIDMHGNCEHNAPDLQFKYPIPLYHEPIYWISDKYKDMFFKTLHEYRKSKHYVSEYIRNPRHPFLFTTKNGKRVHAGDAYKRFKSALMKLYNRHSEKKYQYLHKLGFHSLRHMFGHLRAELYAASGDEIIIYITMHQMGHSNISTTLLYFNLSRETKKNILQNYEKMYQKAKEGNVPLGRANMSA